jgi:Cu-Zn family superoxide dismutase
VVRLKKQEEQNQMKTIAQLFSLTLLFIATVSAQMNPDEKPAVTKAVAVLHPTKGKDVQGVVTFQVVGTGVHVLAHIAGLTPGKHGFHIHEFGDCSSDDGTAAGGHYNPTAMPHSMPSSDKRHVGDLGNIEADSSGMAHLDYIDGMLSLSGPNSIIGRGVIVHEKEDDFKTQPTGNAGARLACGVIGIGKP